MIAQLGAQLPRACRGWADHRGCRDQNVGCPGHVSRHWRSAVTTTGARLIETWKGCPTNTDEVFPLLDHNGDGHISRQEFAELWTEFWAGDNADSPGTWVFGKFEAPQTA